MINLKRNGSGDYILRYWTNGRGSRRAYHNLGKVTHEEAKVQARAVLAESEKSKTLSDPAISFKRLSDLWLKLHATPKLRAGTLASTEAVVRLHLVPTFGTTRVRDLRPVDVEKFQTETMAAKDAPTAATMNLWVNILRQILGWGAAKGIVLNPVPPHSVKALATTVRTVYFEPEEWQKFIAAAEADPQLAATAPVWRFQLLTASRFGEMAALTWGGVDFARKVLTVEQSKVSRSKTLRLSPEMESALSGLIRGVPAAPVFTDEAGKPWKTRALQSRFNRIIEAAGLGGGGVHGRLTTHSIRHTAATWARKAEVPLDRISGILGHKDPAMVLRYAHIQPEDLDGALGAVARAADSSVDEAWTKSR